ncbi:hypothetical protein [Lysobacter sp. Hz 25]|uniref:hypothetical protein n=1 Tax=Lysobacter sp. Hz 25 TaxID=3383698 RepID=UPI0038D4F93C
MRICASTLLASFIGLSCIMLTDAAIAQENWSKVAAQQYKKANEYERLNLCIEAIKRKIICRGCSVANIDQLFSTNFIEPDESTKGLDNLYSGIVHFGPAITPPKNPDPSRAWPEQKGWHLAFKYSKSGKIVTYSLSDLGK